MQLPQLSLWRAIPLKRIFLFTNVLESRPFILVQNYRYGCFTLFRCANNARNWHLVGSHCLNISSQRQKRAAQKLLQSRPADGLCGSAIVKESHLHPGQDKKFRKVGSWRWNQPTGTAVVCCRLVASPLRPLLLLIACALQAHLIFVIFTRMLRPRICTQKVH